VRLRLFEIDLSMLWYRSLFYLVKRRKWGVYNLRSGVDLDT